MGSLRQALINCLKVDAELLSLCCGADSQGFESALQEFLVSSGLHCECKLFVNITKYAVIRGHK